MPELDTATPHPAITQAFVLGAGLGTRLKRLTEVCPKPLIPIAGKPLITFAFDHLLNAGIRKFVINTHHRAEAFARVFPDNNYRGATLAFRHEPVLLETGGGIKNVEDLLGSEPFFVYNGDILSTLPLAPAIDEHFARGNEVTLIVRSQGGPPHIAFDPLSRRVTDIRNRLGRAPGTHLFTGIYIVQPAFLRRLRLEKMSVVPAFLEMIEQNAPLGSVVIDEGEWRDIGTREQYLAVHEALRAADPAVCWVHPTAQVDSTAQITGATYVGAHAKIGPRAQLHDSILWDGTVIAHDSVLTRCIVTDNQTVCGIHTDLDF